MTKPRLNSWIYIVLPCGDITKQQVDALGSEMFYTKNTCYSGVIEEVRWQFYESFNDTWFKDLKSAKENTLEEFTNCKVIKKDEDYWEVVGRD
ncbi:MAG: hypothetical protein R3Y05_01525 [bacterium]